MSSKPSSERPSARPLWSDNDVPAALVPERYRLADAFIPKGRYLDPEFQKLELDRVFSRTWLMACRVEELHGVGSYVEYRIGAHSILIVREAAESIRAYYNACRHRGTRLASGRGRVGSIICPFHGWRWNLDGTIKLVLDREEFVARSDDDLGLQQVKVDTWGGFVFINMDPQSESLFEYLGPIPEVFAPFQFENMRYRWLKGVILPCNWKTALDGFLEAYHVPGTHPQLHRWDKSNQNAATLKEMEQRTWAPTTIVGKFARYASIGRKPNVEASIEVDGDVGKDPAKRTSAGAPDERHAVASAVEYIARDMRALENIRSLRAVDDLRTTELPQGMNAGQFYMELLRKHALADGLDWPVISGKQWAAAGTAWHVFPNTIMLPNQGAAITYRARPNGDDPNSCLFEVFSLEQIPVAEYGLRREFEPQYFDDFRDADVGEVLTQDLDNCENITIGMHSPSFDGHRLSTKQEMTVYNQHKVADHYLWVD